MPTQSRTYLAVAAAMAALAGPLGAQQAPTRSALDPAVLEHFAWRNLGPDRGGRSIAVSGVRGQPNVAYFGATGGGLWKTTDSGESWVPVTDGQITSASVGAVAVSESDPDVVYIGTGESCIRGNIMPGDGVYRSRDGGETWTHVGFENVDAVSKIRIDPRDPNVVYVAVFGKYSVPSEERGVYKSTDGGESWRRVLYRDDETGAVDLSIDPSDPYVVYAALWEAYRKEYQMSSGGAGSGLFRSTDGGESWTELTRKPGLPAEGVVGRIGVSVSGADPERIYALVEHDEGGLFSSDDAGESWTLVNDNRAIRQRAFYYTHVFADPADRDVVYIQNTSLFRSTDGGETTETINNGTHGDFHDLWIDPDDPAHLVVGNDGGGAVSTTTGEAWTDEDVSTAQFYHVITTPHPEYHVCGAQQDNSTLCLPHDWNERAFNAQRARAEREGEGTVDQVAVTSGAMEVAYPAGGGEPGYIAPDPRKLDLFYSGTNNGGYVDKYDRQLGTSREVNPYPWFYSGEPSEDIRERWQWTFPIIFSPIDSTTLYVSSQRLWSTVDGGQTWTALSGDLTRHAPETMRHSGGPITGDMNGPELYATIFSVGPGKIDKDVIWVGSDDGLVHVTRDGGESWSDVTPPEMPEFGRVSQIDASAFDPATAYVSVRRPLLDDRAPYIFRTRDYGQSWTKIVSGIPGDAYVHAVREDPTRQGLLYAATQHGVYVSYDDGAGWESLSLNLPDIPIVDLVVEEGDLVIASHGRGFWVLDDVAPLREMGTGWAQEPVRVFTPEAAVRSSGPATLTYWLRDTPAEARLEILSPAGDVLRSFTPDTSSSEERGGGRFGGPASLPIEPGLNRLTWDLRTEPYTTFPGMILWGARSRAPAVPPGEYTVRLTADGQSATAPLVVRRNPWITGVSDADLQAQFEFSSRVRDRVSDANDAVIEIRRVKAQLEDRLERSDDPRFAAAAAELEESASAVEERIYQVRNRSGQDPLNFPIRVNNRLATLLSMAERGDGRPTNNMPEIFEILSAELQGYLERKEDVWATDLAAVNAELERLGLPAIDPDCEEAEGCAVG